MGAESSGTRIWSRTARPPAGELGASSEATVPCSVEGREGSQTTPLDQNQAFGPAEGEMATASERAAALMKPEGGGRFASRPLHLPREVGPGSSRAVQPRLLV